MPRTISRCSGRRKRPYCPRWATILSARTMPTPGNLSSSAADAVLTLMRAVESRLSVVLMVNRSEPSLGADGPGGFTHEQNVIRQPTTSTKIKGDITQNQKRPRAKSGGVYEFGCVSRHSKVCHSTAPPLRSGRGTLILNRGGLERASMIHPFYQHPFA